MGEVTAAAVKNLREKTRLPMMDCKKALTETGGDEEAAIKWLREHGQKFFVGRDDRTTEEGRIAIYASLSPGAGAMIELQCESAPVATNEEFVQLANDLVKQLATGPGAAAPDDLWTQKSPSQPRKTLAEQKEDLANKIREVFRLKRIVKFDGPCGGYVHHDGKKAALVQVEGGTPELAKDIAMHVVAKSPKSVNKEELPAEDVAKEREILTETSRREGKPENIIEKMVEGRMRNYYAEVVLNEQPFVKDDKLSVGQVAKSGGMKIVKFAQWQLGQS